MKQFDDKIETTQLDWLVLLVMSTAFFSISISVQGFLALMPFVSAEFSLSRAQAGMYQSLYFVSATLVAVWSGRIIDRLGSKWGLVSGVLGIGVLMLLHAFAAHYAFVLVLAFFAGIGFSFITPSTNKGIMELVPSRHRAISMGIVLSGSGVGGFVGGGVLPLLAQAYGWRMAVVFSSLVSICVAPFIWRFYKPKVSKEARFSISVSVGQSSLWADVARLFKNRFLVSVYVLGVAWGLCMGAIPAHYSLYLHQDIGLSPALAGLSLGFLQVGGLFGRPTWGFVSEGLFAGNRRNALFLLGFATSVSILGFSQTMNHFATTTLVVLGFSFVLGFTSQGWAGLHWTTVSEATGSEKAGLGSGVGLVFSRFGVFISPPIVGYISGNKVLPF